MLNTHNGQVLIALKIVALIGWSVGCSTPAQQEATKPSQPSNEIREPQPVNEPAKSKPLKPWSPPERDLVRIGAALNRVAAPMQPIAKLLIDAAEMRSGPHANYAESLLKAHRASEAIGDATDVVSHWPEGRHKQDAQRTIAAYARFSITVAEAIGHAKARDYEAAGSSMQEAARRMQGAMDPMIRLWTSTSVADWETSLKKETFIGDSGTKVFHRPDCRILAQRDAQIRKDTEAKIRKAWAGIGSEPWAKDLRKVRALGVWAKRPQGSRGPCPVDLSEHLLRDSLPRWLGAFVPVSADSTSGYRACGTCRP